MARSKWSRWIVALIISLLASQVYLSTRLSANGGNGDDADDPAVGRPRSGTTGGGAETSGRRHNPGISDRMARDLMNYAMWNVGKDLGGSRTTGDAAAASLSSSSWLVGHNNHTFPRWGDEGIDLDALLDYIRQLGKNPAQRVLVDRSSPFSEVPFVIDESGAYLSLALRNQIPKRQIRHRIFPVQRSIYRAWRHLTLILNASDLDGGDGINNSNSNISSDDAGTPSFNGTATPTENVSNLTDEAFSRWPNLIRAVRGGGFPFVLWEGDFRSCNRHNYRMADWEGDSARTRVASVPIFTTCAHVNCSYAFPFPTYETISELKTRAGDWEYAFRRYGIRHPWHNKTKKLLWRGSLSGPLLNYTSPRARLAIFATQNRHHPLLDVGLHSIPSRHWPNRTSSSAAAHEAIETDSGPSTSGRQPLVQQQRRDAAAALDLSALLGPSEMLADFVPSSEFARYAAILDTDGNSWSSRFGRLLCTNSIILKVQPQFVDYFYKYLEPWAHYVPVRDDLGDLLEKVEWALDPHNYERVQTIIRQANTFCAERMVPSSVTRDILDILEAYVMALDRHDPRWSDKWAPFKREMLSSHNQTYEMLKMTGRKCRYAIQDECYVPDRPPPFAVVDPSE